MFGKKSNDDFFKIPKFMYVIWAFGACITMGSMLFIIWVVVKLLQYFGVI